MEKIPKAWRESIDYGDMYGYPVVVSHAFGRLIIVNDSLHKPILRRGSSKINAEMKKTGVDTALNHLRQVELIDTETGAKLSPAIQSYCLEVPEDRGFCEYAFFGDENREERVRLLAGLGMLARRAS